jgi:nucleoredoxin
LTRFTPVLAEFYEDLKINGELEIVFVSSDRDQASFSNYFGKMPWVALPLNSPFKSKLSSMFGVSGIPMLVILNADDGKLKDADGRTAVSNSRGDSASTVKKWISSEGRQVAAPVSQCTVM